MISNELLFLVKKKHKDTLIAQAKTKPQESLKFRLKTPKKTFSFNPLINLSEEKISYSQ